MTFPDALLLCVSLDFPPGVRLFSRGISGLNVPPWRMQTAAICSTHT